MGSYRGESSLNAFAFKRCIMRRDDHGMLDIPIRYPPYTKFGLRFATFAVNLPNIPPVTLTSVGVMFALFAAAAYGIVLYEREA